MLIRFRNALAFLSRLAPPAPMRDNDDTLLADAVPFYPLVGLLLGFIATLPACVFGPTWLAAWAYVLILAWLTRGLHWDGLADLADACGSNATGDKFWEIIKDSRIGAFGVMALSFGIFGQVVAAQTCIAGSNLQLLILAPAFGRATVIALGRFTHPHPSSTLAALIQPGIRSPQAVAAFLLTLLLTLFLFGPLAFIFSAVLTTVCLVILVRIATAHGGVNGDFHGTAIIAAETAILLIGIL